ncbi:MAG TPA: cytochrome c oxidase assembly protein [Solirubrobacterales bacterium]|nr:cytochrome c oxidase assembly protein [Solirubrobacterales bacterium]
MSSLPLAGIVSTFWSVMEVAVPLAVAAAYLKRAHRLGLEGRPLPGWRQLCFGLGVVVFGASVAGPVDVQADKLLWVHMIQHLMLADIASLLIVLGFTGPLLQPLLTFRAGRPLRRLTHPVVAITIFTLNLYIWHIPFLYQAVLTDESLHVLEHLLFFGTGILLWMPLFGPLPKPQWFGKGAHVIYTVFIWAPAMVMANVFMWSDVVMYPDYSKTAEAAGITPIADQSTSGAILMGECTLLALGIFAWVFLRWAKEDIEKQDLLDLAIDRHVELTPARAARAVAAGRGPELRARIEAGQSIPEGSPGAPGG